jgi:hypothetical protein
MKLNVPRPTSSLAIALLASSLALPTLPHRAAAEMPAGLEEALTGHAWSFPKAKPPVHFLIDGTVVDGNGTFRFWWDLDKSTGTVHLLEKGPKDKDKARIDLWFWSNLEAFSWYDSHGQSSGVGIRLDEPAKTQTAATPPVKEPEKSAPPLPFDPKSAPSVQLQTFATAWLEKLVGPLDAAPLPRAALMQLQTDFQARLPLATAQQKPAYQAALQTCTTFSNLMDARDKARTALSNAQAVTATSVGKKMSKKLVAQRDNDFVNSGAVSSANSQWQQQQTAWRDAIQQLMVREKQAELVANSTPGSPSVAPASANPTSTPAH